jgi:hypothetical protein
VTVTLLSSGLVDVNLQDQQLAKLLVEDPRPVLMNFTANLIRECLSAEPPVATQGQFVYSLEVLSQLDQAGKATEESVILFYSLQTAIDAILTESFVCSMISGVLDATRRLSNFEKNFLTTFNSG